jgi:hypothetical protein
MPGCSNSEKFVILNSDESTDALSGQGYSVLGSGETVRFHALRSLRG